MIELTRPGKNTLVVEQPLMPAAGVFGYGDLYRDLIEIELMGAVVTNPITAHPWNPATGTRVIPLDGGFLMHTGLPNLGLSKLIGKYRQVWKSLTVPVIVHLVATTQEDIRRCVSMIDREDSISAIELGLNDDISPVEAERLVEAAVEHSEKPVLVRLPYTDAEILGRAAADVGAGGLVVCAPPRGTARDTTGKLIGGRMYGPLLKPLILRLVGQMARRIDLPLVAAGGVHSAQDVRDYLEAGARAVQIDSALWVRPSLVNSILHELNAPWMEREE